MIKSKTPILSQKGFSLAGAIMAVGIGAVAITATTTAMLQTMGMDKYVRDSSDISNEVFLINMQFRKELNCAASFVKSNSRLLVPHINATSEPDKITELWVHDPRAASGKRLMLKTGEIVQPGITLNSIQLRTEKCLTNCDLQKGEATFLTNLQLNYDRDASGGAKSISRTIPLLITFNSHNRKITSCSSDPFGVELASENGEIESKTNEVEPTHKPCESGVYYIVKNSYTPNTRGVPLAARIKNDRNQSITVKRDPIVTINTYSVKKGRDGKYPNFKLPKLPSGVSYTLANACERTTVTCQDGEIKYQSFSTGRKC